ncbi:MAG: thioredoxin family protein [Oscillospiraceae bacterium]|jgi:thioredoxin-like negative regulator of GroEL|nr:thioredoxin family protein [Oscillospiraceae bacterium]
MQREQPPGRCVLECWAPWCDSSRRVALHLAELSAEPRRNLRFVRLDTEEKPETAAQYHVRVLPTVLLLEEDRVLARLEGERSQGELARFCLVDHTK